MENKWNRYSELEKGLISVLLVLIPFIVLMISIYTYFLIVPIPDKKINHDDDMPKENVPTNFSINATDSDSDQTDDETKLTNDTASAEDEGATAEEDSMAKIKRSVVLKSNQFISSIIENIFLDEPELYYLKCPAVLLKNNYIITGFDCLKTNLTFVKIRSLSNFWSKDGIISSILEVTHFNELYSFGKLTKPVRYYNADVSIIYSPSETLKNIEYIDVYQWNDTYLSDDFKQRKKYEPLSKMLLKVSDDNDCKNFPNNFKGLCAIETKNSVNSAELNGRSPIFEVNTNNLIGFEVKRYFYNNILEHYYTFIYNVTI